MTRRALQQGAVDGLCGLYSLVNFLRRERAIPSYKDFDSNHVAFRCLLESASQLGLLTPALIVSGYDWHHLFNIFNRTCLNLSLSWAAVPLHRICAQENIETFTSLAEFLGREKAQAVISHSKGNHWVLFERFAGDRVLISNSDGLKQRDQYLSKGQFKDIEPREGIAIVPKSSLLVQLI